MTSGGADGFVAPCSLSQAPVKLPHHSMRMDDARGLAATATSTAGKVDQSSRRWRRIEHAVCWAAITATFQCPLRRDRLVIQRSNGSRLAGLPASAQATARLFPNRSANSQSCVLLLAGFAAAPDALAAARARKVGPDRIAGASAPANAVPGLSVTTGEPGLAGRCARGMHPTREGRPLLIYPLRRRAWLIPPVDCLLCMLRPGTPRLICHFASVISELMAAAPSDRQAGTSLLSCPAPPLDSSGSRPVA